VKKESLEKEGVTPLLYYFKGDKLVFTEEYHKQRGYCCGCGCINCPFTPKHSKGTTTIKKS